MDIHIGNKGVEVRFTAGYLNRSARRRLAKARRHRCIPPQMVQMVARKNA